jgi:hypothetical protein
MFDIDKHITLEAGLPMLTLTSSTSQVKPLFQTVEILDKFKQ